MKKTQRDANKEKLLDYLEQLEIKYSEGRISDADFDRLYQNAIDLYRHNAPIY